MAVVILLQLRTDVIDITLTFHLIPNISDSHLYNIATRS